ncbi:hypothetical protein [Cohnella sp. GCM10027633]|uniref:hypothetical protein n=1 Tax=unclassified Cohnella TaxID=2636738 RepID=UPI003639A1DA
MQRVVVTEFIVGKTVAQDIYTKQGMLLLKAGHRVTSSMVERLEKNAIRFIYVS